jgi:hypothetical protein
LQKIIFYVVSHRGHDAHRSHDGVDFLQIKIRFARLPWAPSLSHRGYDEIHRDQDGVEFIYFLLYFWHFVYSCLLFVVTSFVHVFAL